MTETDDAAAPEETAPTCYRHGDRETYVRCIRCDRPICPDCMTAASVGFQCPECVKEGNKSIRQARTVFGGRVVEDSTVVKVLIAINVVAFVAQLASATVTDDYAMEPYAVAYHGEFYRMLTSAFLHSPGFLLHIGFNMYALFAFGGHLERLLGPVRFLVLYVVAAFGGSVASLLFIEPVTFTALADGRTQAIINTSIGASGAVFGLFGAYFVLARKLRADTSQILVLIGINLAIGFVGSRYINNWAHIGGLATGAAIAFVYASVPRGRWRTAVQFTGVAAVAALLVVVATVKVADLRQEPDPFRSPPRAAATSVTGAPSR